MSDNRKSRRRPFTRARIKNASIDAIFYILLLTISLTCLLPFVHIFAKSISKEAYVIANKIFLIPKEINFHAYQKGVSGCFDCQIPLCICNRNRIVYGHWNLSYHQCGICPKQNPVKREKGYDLSYHVYHVFYGRDDSGLFINEQLTYA